MQRVVANELILRLRHFAVFPRVALHSFIMDLVDAWNSDRNEDPDEMPSAASVTRTVWEAAETNLMFIVPEDAGALTIADVLETAGKDCFGGHRWNDMEDYINRLTPRQRQQINLQEFTEILYDVLRDFGTPE